MIGGISSGLKSRERNCPYAFLAPGSSVRVIGSRQLDVVFREDQCRARLGHSARNLSVLRKFVLASWRKEEGSKMGLNRRRLHADRNESYRESLITLAFSDRTLINCMNSA